MRKWMRERLQRRKKTPAGPSDQPAPPPLQPAYFDAEQAPGAAPDTKNEEPEVSLPAPVSEDRPTHDRPIKDRPTEAQPSSEDAPSEAQPPAGQRAAGGSSAGRSRRRRGGRGRGGRGREQAVAQAFTPAAVKGSIPEVPVEAAEQAVPASEPEAVIPGAEPVVEASKVAASVPVAAPRPPKGIVVLAIGLPGSGKSSWFKRHNV